MSRRVPLALSAVALVSALVVGHDPAGASDPHRAAKLPALTTATRGNGLVAFTSKRTSNNEILTAFSDGSNQIDISNNAASDSQPAWSPDGLKVLFTRNIGANNEVFVMNADGTAQVNLTNNGGSDSEPAWKPDGTKIAFASKRTGNNEIFVMNADGTGQVDLTNNSAADNQPAWSPDGTKILFTRKLGTNSEVFVMNADGTGQVDLSNNSASDSQAAWSPDGTKIAFTSSRGGNDDVWVMNADGTTPVDLTNNASSDSDPVYSPDHGSRIAFTSDRDGNSEVYLMDSLDGSAQINLVHNSSTDSQADWQPLPAGPANGSPIQHIVILYQENHSFDNVLGKLCATLARCDGATSGQLHDGTTIPLGRAADIVPFVAHDGTSQATAENGGLMNGFDLLTGCTAQAHVCYTQFSKNQIPTLWSLAANFTISDRTFEQDIVPSFQAHVELAASQLDGFAKTQNPFGSPLPGWGCDSHKKVDWQSTVFDPILKVPSCVPDLTGFGPFQPSSVPWVPTIMDRMDEAGLSWHLYAPDATQGFGYGWAICPTFADCLYTSQEQKVLLSSQFQVDAAAGTLPSLSIVIPVAPDSQHNQHSMKVGDNWISTNVNAVMSGPDWATTAIFIVYDDCGCFYDHVNPPSGLGIRVPMVIVSPFAKPAFTDSTDASYDSMLAFTEHTFGLAPLSPKDADAYDYSNSFNYTQRPIGPIPLSINPIPQWEIDWMAAHPADPDDPT